jgi:type III secretion protein Q
MNPVPSAATLRLTATEADARNALAQKVRGCRFDWSGEAWELTMVPLTGPAPAQAHQGRWLLQASWGGALFEVVLPGAAAQGWIQAAHPEIDAPHLPPEYAAALIEDACAGLMDALAARERGTARLEALLPGPAPATALPHAFSLELRHGDGVVRGRLATDALGLMLMAGLAVGLPPVRNALPADELPVRLRAELGFTWLTAGEIGQLEVGDAVLMEHVFFTPDGELWLGEGDWGLRAYWSDTGLTVTSELNQGGWTMSHDDESAGSDAALDSLAALPLRLAFDLGERSITLGELRQLQVGQTLDLGRPLTSAVSLRVNGALVGTGELVEIDGRIGVAIGTLANRASPPAMPAAARAGVPDTHAEDDDDNDDDGFEDDEAAELEGDK